jgi:hypothetical protein
MNNDWKMEITLGIPDPDEEPKSVNEMRVAILEASHDSSLIARSMHPARYLGLSGEDTYVSLAYYALRELERLWKMQQRWDACQIRSFVMPEGTLKPRP